MQCFHSQENFRPIELKRCRMKLDISLHNRLQDTFHFSQGRCGRVPRQIVKSNHGPDIIRIGPIKLKLGRIMPDTSTNDVHIKSGRRLPTHVYKVWAGEDGWMECGCPRNWRLHHRLSLSCHILVQLDGTSSE